MATEAQAVERRVAEARRVRIRKGGMTTLDADIAQSKWGLGRCEPENPGRLAD